MRIRRVQFLTRFGNGNGSTAPKPEPIPDEEDPQYLLLAQKRMEHEMAFLAGLKQQGRQIVEISREKSGFHTTIEAMEDGADIIYQSRQSAAGLHWQQVRKIVFGLRWESGEKL